MKIPKLITKILIAGTLLWMIIYIVGGIYSSLNTFTSFPWWSAFVFAAIYFLPALIIEGLAYGIFVCLEKRKQ